MAEGKAYGVEVDRGALNFLRLNNFKADSVIDKSNNYDVICMLQVLEHLYSPLETISELSKIIKDDGRLLISIPNAGEYSKIGLGWIGFRVDLEHINYFDLGSLSNLLLNHEFYIEHFWEHNQPVLMRKNINQTHDALLNKIRNKTFQELLIGYFMGNKTSLKAVIL